MFLESAERDHWFLPFLVFLNRMAGQGWYDTAQICANGHLITAAANQNPERKQPFSLSCGAMTTTICPACGKPSRGGALRPRSQLCDGQVGYGRWQSEGDPGTLVGMRNSFSVDLCKT